MFHNTGPAIDKEQSRYVDVLARGTDSRELKQFLEEDLSERVGLYSSSSSETRVRALFWRRSRVKDLFFTLHLSLVREHDDPLNSTCINE